MSPVQVSCPACGAAVIFKIGTSIVTICTYCHSVVARGDRDVENLGKVADLVDTDSPLEIGLEGRYQGVKFSLTGRAQLGHPAGGMWDEWYAAFADDRWGWLAEAQGRFYLTFEAALPENLVLPAFDALEAGQSLPIDAGGGPMVVAEKSQARALGAAGEIPYRLEPGRTVNYADLSGRDGSFATLDYGDETPLVYLGRAVTLDDLGVSKKVRRRSQDTRQVEGRQLSCPQCGGPLELRAPDKTERVGCPNCGALLDVNEGELRFLKALEPGKVQLAFPLGSVGRWHGEDWIAIGLIVRSVVYEGVTYYWEEYLLYNNRLGFRWLVCSDGHWSFVEPVPPGEVSVRAQKAYYRDKRFKLFQKSDAQVAYVVGECYWKVEVGESVNMADFILPPEMLSREMTAAGESSEINWSLGTYVTPAEVEQAFGVAGLQRPSTVGPIQPFRYKKIYQHWALLALALCIFGAFFLLAIRPNKVYERSFVLTPQVPGQAPEPAREFFSEQPLELKAHKNIRVTARAIVDNSWVSVEGDLIDEETGLVQAFDVPVEYYHGVDGGESWSEGGQSADVYLSALPAGKYTLRLDIQREKVQQPLTVDVVVEQGVPHLLPWFLTLLALSAFPLLLLGYHWYFEAQRWKDSDYSPYSSSSDS